MHATGCNARQSDNIGPAMTEQARAPIISSKVHVAPWHSSKCIDLVFQVSLPVITVDACPVGFSLIGPPGSDEALLELTEKLMHILKS